MADRHIDSDPRRYDWPGGLGTSWLTYPQADPVAILSTQSVGFLFGDGLRDG